MTSKIDLIKEKYIFMELQDIKPVVVCWSPQLAYIKKRKCDFGVYSPTGIWGDPTLATKAKGKMVVEALIKEVVEQIHQLEKFEKK